MAQHVLMVEAPDTMNQCILKLVDSSIYSSLTPLTCPLLQVTVPGFNQPVNFTDATIAPGFILNLTACDLELQTSQCGTVYSNLPDGIYIIKYSVSPNEYVFVEYNHLRITCAMHKYQEILCSLDLGACLPPDKTQTVMDQLGVIRRYLEAAKAHVEWCHNPKKGMELYRYAVKLLEKILCTTCKTC